MHASAQLLPAVLQNGELPPDLVFNPFATSDPVKAGLSSNCIMCRCLPTCTHQVPLLAHMHVYEKSLLAHVHMRARIADFFLLIARVACSSPAQAWASQPHHLHQPNHFNAFESRSCGWQRSAAMQSQPTNDMSCPWHHDTRSCPKKQTIRPCSSALAALLMEPSTLRPMLVHNIYMLSILFRLRPCKQSNSCIPCPPTHMSGTSWVDHPLHLYLTDSMIMPHRPYDITSVTKLHRL